MVKNKQKKNPVMEDHNYRHKTSTILTCHLLNNLMCWWDPVDRKMFLYVVCMVHCTFTLLSSEGTGCHNNSISASLKLK